MSDLSPTDDELISAYLDDEVTTAERASIETDARALARVARLRAVRDQVAAPVTPLSEADRERLLARALAVSHTTPVVTSMTATRRRPVWARRPLLAVAAAAAVLALAVPVLRNVDLGGDASDDTAAGEPAAEATTMAQTDADTARAEIAPGAEAADVPAAEPAEEAAAEPAEEPLSDTTSGDDGATDDEVAADEALAPGFEPLLPGLGEFTTIDQLVDQVFSDFGEWLDDPEAVNERSFGLIEIDPEPCADEFVPTPDIEDQMSDVATATVGDALHVVWLFDDGVVYIATADSCSPTTRSDYFNR